MLSLEDLRKEFEESFVSENIEYKVDTNIAVSFDIGGELYCFPVAQVQEIVKLQHIITVPRSPRFVLGVFNLRGEILSLNWLGEFLNHSFEIIGDVDVGSMAIVLKSPIGRVGLLTSDAPKLIRYSEDNEVENFDKNENDIISGQIKKDGNIYSLLNAKVLFERMLELKNWERDGR